MQILQLSISGTVGTPHMGPVSSDICELSNHFQTRGHNVILADLRAEAARNLLHPSIRVTELSGTPESCVEQAAPNKAMAVLHHWRNYYQYVRQLNSQLDLSTPDVVHVHSPILAFLLQRLHRVPVVYTAHTPLWSVKPNGLARSTRVFPSLGTLVMRAHDWVERDVVRRSRVSIGLGSYLASSVPGAPVVTIPNGLNLDTWIPLERNASRDALGIGPNEFVVLFCGRVHPDKGLDSLMQAVRAVAPTMPELRVLIIGPLSGSFDTADERTGSYARTLVERSRDLPVRFLGFINNREHLFRQHLAAADVSVVPSLIEPQGLVVLEALAMGVPVIGAATGGIVDMVTPDVGYLFTSGDAVSLAKCISQAHDDRSRLQQMRSVARARVEQHYSWSSVGDRYLDAFARQVNVEVSLRPSGHSTSVPTTRPVA